MSVLPDNMTLAKASQTAVVEWLKAAAEFDGVPIIGRREGSIDNDIDAAIAALGACIYVLPGLPVHFLPNEQSIADRYQIRVRVIENTAINTTLPDLYELVELVGRRLAGVAFPAIGLTNALVYPEANPIQPVGDEERQIQDVVFETDAVFLPRID